MAPYPFTTIEPHTGVVDVLDERLITLALLVKPQKVTPAQVKFVDIAGLVRGASKGEGLGNEFLGHIREVEAILHVLRAFENAQAPHPLGTIDPQRDFEIVQTELILKDLATLEKQTEEKDKVRESAVKKLIEGLNKGKLASEVNLTAEEKESVRDLFLLTAKPQILVLNVSESQLEQKFPPLGKFKLIPLCGKLEAEITELSAPEQRAYLKELGLAESGLEKVIKSCYELLSLITFFTIKGGKEVRAWPIKRGETAFEAAGMIHTDIAHGFIKAEVLKYEDLVAVGSFAQAHEKGRVRVEGKDYQIREGEVVEFKFHL